MTAPDSLPACPRREELISRLHLRELPGESGRFAEVSISGLQVESSGGALRAHSSIHYLLDRAMPVNFLHRLESDDVHVLCEGGPVDYFLFHPDGRSERVTLGRDLSLGHRFLLAIPAGTWKALVLQEDEDYVLLANVLSPQWTEDRVEVGAGDAFLERFIGTSTWASREFLTALIGPNRR
jgi:predicted cupin superfamily sugar epimerase